MKISPRNFLSVSLLGISTFFSCLLAVGAFAEPIEYSEVSLLVRAHESEPSIIREVSNRKLVHALTAQQENTLKAQGAHDSLIQALRAPAVVLSAADVSAYETRRDQSRAAQKTADAPHPTDNFGAAEPEGLHIFEVAPGFPVNLSQWGGPDYDFAFHAPTRL